ncbi:MAG: hypothetical protein Q7T07_15790 [Burkholderiaceae bacterium]|nr:hypothetical protein [Burkholderiaceae bacterium]
MKDIKIYWPMNTPQAEAKMFDTIGWGVMLIWIGLAFLANVGWGVGLIGVGVIMISTQVARAYFDLKVDRFGMVFGVFFAMAGVSRVLDLQADKVPFATWIVSILFVIAGVAIIVTTWMDGPRR